MKRAALAIAVSLIFCLGLAIDARQSLGAQPDANGAAHPGASGAAYTAAVAALPSPTAYAASPAPPPEALGAASSYQDQNVTVGRFCFRCHNDSSMTGGLSLESFDVGQASDNAELAEKMVRKLRAGMMPPRQAQQPDADAVAALVNALETNLDTAALADPNPGSRTFQRLNQAEYTASVRDLLGITVDVDTFLPPDTISASFDNIADVQMPSATLMEGYLRAAGYVSRVAVGDPYAGPDSSTYNVPRTSSQKGRAEGAPFGTRGGIAVVHNFPADGKYEFQLLLHGEPAGLFFGRTVPNEQIEVSIDGERVAVLDIDRWMSESDPTGLTLTTNPIDIRAGARKVAAAFVLQNEGPEDDLITPIDHTLADTQIGVGYGVTTLPHLRDLAIVGPFEVTGVSDNPTRERIFSCRVVVAQVAEQAADVGDQTQAV